MSECRSHDHPEDKYRCITITLSSEEELATRTTPGKGKGQTSQDHTTEVPDLHGVGNGLVFKTGVKLAHDEVYNKGDNNKGYQPQEEMVLPE